MPDRIQSAEAQSAPSESAQVGSIDVVLVSPRNPLNIGAVARAMANFSFAHLSVVAPYEPHWREARSAVGAPDLLQNANESSTLSEAVAHCTLVIGTGTLTHRKPEQRVVQLPDLPPIVQSELNRGGRVALVFGPEKHGLTRDDLSWCHLLVEIPTDPRQPSMNLGQAVAVCLYELASRMKGTGFNPYISGTTQSYRHSQTEERVDPAVGRGLIPGKNLAGSERALAPEACASDSSIEDEPFFAASSAPKANLPPTISGPSAPSSTLDLLATVIEETMLAARYSPRSMQAANRHDLRLLLRRLAPTPRDVRRILGLFRRILWRLKQSPKGK